MDRIKLGLVTQGEDLFAVHAYETTGEIESSQYLCAVDHIDNLIDALTQVKKLWAEKEANKVNRVLH